MAILRQPFAPPLVRPEGPLSPGGISAVTKSTQSHPGPRLLEFGSWLHFFLAPPKGDYALRLL